MGKKNLQYTSDPRVAFFDRNAGSWDADAPAVDSNLRGVKELQGMMGLRGGLDVLEVGCGTGQITPWLCSMVAPGRVLAVDFSEAMLAAARAKGIDAEFRLLDICRESPGQAEFDVALCFHSFPHFRDQAAALRNLSSALRPGGALLVVHLAGSKEINAMHSGIGGAVGRDHLPPGPTWPTLLAEAGLNLDRLTDRDGLFFLRAEKK